MDDVLIVKLYWDRDENAIPATSEKYGRYCYAIAGNILSNEEDAKECVNDTYSNAWNSMPPHRPNILSTFLGKITRNISFNLYKKNHTEKRGYGQISLVLDELAECISDKDTPEKEYIRNELVSTINAFLKILPPQKRQIFICRYWYADSVSNIANRFGLSENNVSVMLNRLRKKLHDYLNERGYKL